MTQQPFDTLSTGLLQLERIYLYFISFMLSEKLLLLNLGKCIAP